MTNLERLVFQKEGAKKRLTESEERELIERYQRGDKSAGGEIVAGSLSLVVSIALEYRRWGASLDDVVQEGCIGLLAAVTRFEPARGNRLSTYAAYWIRAQIREFVMRGYRTVRVGTTKDERRAVRHFRATREDDPVKLAEASGLSVERARELLPVLMHHDPSLEAEGAFTGASLLDRLEAEGPTPEDLFADEESGERTRVAYEEAMGELSAREQEILRARVDREEPLTLSEIGERLGVSKERVRQLEARACQKIRAKMVAQGIAA